MMFKKSKLDKVLMPKKKDPKKEVEELELSLDMEDEEELPEDEMSAEEDMSVDMSKDEDMPEDEYMAEDEEMSEEEGSSVDLANISDDELLAEIKRRKLKV